MVGGLLLSLFIMIPNTRGENNLITFHSIKSSENSGGTSENEYLTAYCISGIRNSLYFAFDFSEFPTDITPQFSVFRVKTVVAMDPCNVDAFYFPSAEWVNTNTTRDSESDVKTLGVSNYVVYGEEWYDYTSDSLTWAVTKACLERGTFTVVLKAKANVYGDSIATFYPDAKLDVVFSPITSNAKPSPSIPEFPSFVVLSSFAIATLVGAFFLKRSKPSKGKT